MCLVIIMSAFSAVPTERQNSSKLQNIVTDLERVRNG